MLRINSWRQRLPWYLIFILVIMHWVVIKGMHLTNVYLVSCFSLHHRLNKRIWIWTNVSLTALCCASDSMLLWNFLGITAPPPESFWKTMLNKRAHIFAHDQICSTTMNRKTNMIVLYKKEILCHFFKWEVWKFLLVQSKFYVL